MTLKEEILKPINIISLSIGIIGIILSVVFYLSGKKTKAISYQITEPSSLIYDSHNSSSAIKVLDKDSILINGDVYILTGVIWNSGNLSIINEDVRQNLSLNFKGIKKILDYKIVKQIDPTIAKFTLSTISEKSILINWKYFDPGYAMKFQVIYIGNSTAGFELKGKILDVDNFTKVLDESKDLTETRYFSLGFAILITIFSFLSIIKEFSKSNQFSKRRFIVFALFLIQGIGLIVLVIVKLKGASIPLTI